MEDVHNNKFLLIKEGVILTPSITPVILLLEPRFAAASLVAYVTSGKRFPEDQLRVIRQYLTKKGLAEKYPLAMTCALNDFDKQTGTFVWQMAWSNLLHIGVIINPPIKSACLMNTTFDNRNRKGKIIPGTTHQRGGAFDVGGNKNGISDEEAIIRQAMADKIEGLISFKPEHDNNAVHCECKLILTT